MKKKILKNIEKWCKEYVVCVIIYAVIFTVGGYVKDSPEMRGAAFVSVMLVVWMVAFISWKQIKSMMNRRSCEDEKVKKYFDEHGSYIKRRAQRLYEEVKNKYADNGIMLYDDNLKNIEHCMINGERYLTTMGLLDLEMLLETIEFDVDNIKEQLKSDHSITFGFESSGAKMFSIDYMFDGESSDFVKRGVIFYCRLMTEEEILQRKLLKEMGIEQ